MIERILLFLLSSGLADEPGLCTYGTEPYHPGRGEWHCDYDKQMCTLSCPRDCHMKRTVNNPIHCHYGEWLYGINSPKCQCSSKHVTTKHKRRKNHPHAESAAMPIMCGAFGMPHSHGDKNSNRKNRRKRNKHHF